MMLLQGLKNRDQRLGFASDSRHRFLDKTEINAWHGRIKLRHKAPLHSPYFGNTTPDIAKGGSDAQRAKPQPKGN